ncbi:hypothetical protein [Marmoricola sp. RAF53]|uniref:hypothetical protein n=1 Tax=Marmoricola sp. RAF53 TaxID=3233059 RepID=UPI003F9E1D56
MRVSEVDEESTDSEFDGPTFRVFLFDRHGDSFACGVHEILGADVSDVLTWAAEQHADLYAVALMVRCGDQLQAHWIEGTDPNNVPYDDVERASRERLFRKFDLPDPNTS